MAKLNTEVPNPGEGGTYMFDPETGKSTLVPETDSSSDNGSNKNDKTTSKDGLILWDCPISNYCWF